MKSISRILQFVIFAIAAVQLLLFPKWTVDDAFISYRFGKNLVGSGELAWNAGEKPVEGYTGIALPLLAATAISMNFLPEEFIRLISILAFLLSGFLLWRFLIAKQAGIWIASGALMSWMLNPLALSHAHSGLETMLFSVAILGAFVVWMNSDAGNKLHFGMALLCTIVALIRPEGAILGILICVAILLSNTGNRRLRNRNFLGMLIAFGLPLAAYHIWRINYYDSILPNTWHAKQYDGIANPESLKQIAEFKLLFLLPILLPFLLIFAGNWKTIRLQEWKSGKLIRQTFPFLIFFCFLFGIYLTSWLFMGFSFRFFFPVLPVFITVIALLSGRLNEKIPDGKRKTLVVALLFSGLLLQAMVFSWKAPGEWQYADQYKKIMENEWREAAKEIASKIDPGKTIACYQDAGLIPYLLPNRCIDFGMLNDSWLAAERRKPEEVVEYFFECNPAAAVFTSFSDTIYVYNKEAEMIQADERFGEYRLHKVYTNLNGDYCQFLYFRSIGSLSDRNPELQ